MIRTLATIAALAFVLAVACLAGAFAIAGGPFTIDDDWHFHRSSLPLDNTCLPTAVRGVVRHAV
jgi:hypothetical protein